jgi:hypothetical protein
LLQRSFQGQPAGLQQQATQHTVQTVHTTYSSDCPHNIQFRLSTQHTA